MIQKSLTDRIRNASSDSEIVALLREGIGYKFASPATSRRWYRKAQARLNQLGRKPVAKEVALAKIKVNPKRKRK